MDDNRRKLLTEMLGEEWYEIDPATYGLCPYCKSEDIGPQVYRGAYDMYYICISCKMEFNEPMKDNYRTFTSPDDMMALKDRIVEMGEWDSFVEYQDWHFDHSKTEWWNAGKFAFWLLDPTRFPELVATWWEERKVKG